MPAGSVVSQDPQAGSVVTYGAAVRLVVSKGPEPAAKVKVPNVTGMTQAAAAAALEAAGFSVSVTEAHSNLVAVGLVVSQTPFGGVEVSLPATVALVVSKGPDADAVERTRQLLADSFDRADGDGNGELTLEEARSLVPTLSEAMFAALDADGNGVLSREEVGLAVSGCGCGCAKSDLSLDSLKSRAADLFLGALALVLLAGFGQRRRR